MEVIPFFSSIVEMFQDMFDAKDDSSATFEEAGQVDIPRFQDFKFSFFSLQRSFERNIYLTSMLDIFPLFLQFFARNQQIFTCAENTAK